MTEKKVEHASIAAALSAAQMAMGPALKTTNNPHFKTKYADLSSVVEACLEALNANGIAVIQPPGEDESGRYVETILLHVGGDRLSCRVPLIVQKNDMQGYGSAVTYARRYGLMCMTGITPEDDDGNAAAAAAPPRQSQLNARDQIRPEQLAIRAAVDSLGNSESMDQLAAIWVDLPRDVQMNKPVIDAKDKSKARLANESVTEDKIPY